MHAAVEGGREIKVKASIFQFSPRLCVPKCSHIHTLTKTLFHLPSAQLSAFIAWEILGEKIVEIPRTAKKEKVFLTI